MNQLISRFYLMLKLQKLILSTIITFVLFSAFQTKLYAQYLSLSGVSQTKILSEFTDVDLQLLNAYGAEIDFSNHLIFKFDYNLGAEFLMLENGQIFFLKTGLSYAYLTPSGFNKAKSKESVSYTTNNWFSSLNLNIYNGIYLQDSTSQYLFAAEPTWNLYYVLGKKKSIFIGGEIGLRYTLFPNEEYLVSNEISIPIQIGIRYGF